MVDKINAEDVFRAEDFESIRLIVYFKDFTTNTIVRDLTKTSIQEVGNKSLVLELPEKSCNTKHNVAIKICNSKEEELLAITGKVTEVENVGDGFIRVSVDCIQYDEQSWTRFTSLFSDRQSEIDGFLAAARGY